MHEFLEEICWRNIAFLSEKNKAFFYLSWVPNFEATVSMLKLKTVAKIGEVYIIVDDEEYCNMETIDETTKKLF